MAESSIKTKTWIYFGLCHLSEWSGGLFDKFKTCLTFENLVQYFVTFLFGFSARFFEMEFNHLPDLLNNGLQSLKCDCFMVANTWEQKYAASWLVLKRCRCFINRTMTWLSFDCQIGWNSTSSHRNALTTRCVSFNRFY